MKSPIWWLATLGAMVVIACSNTSESPGGAAEVPSQDREPYRLEIKAPAKAQVGQEARTEIVVTPGAGYKINVEYPAKLTLSKVPEGTKVASTTITTSKMNVEKTRLVVPVAFTPEGPGAKQFEGELRFSVCNPESCQMPRETVSWTTSAEVAAP